VRTGSSDLGAERRRPAWTTAFCFWRAESLVFRRAGNAVEAAGFHEIRVRSATLPLIFEGGIAQAARALAATPLAPSLATLPAGTHLRLNAAIGAHLAPLLGDGKVSANMTSNIATART
jgi:hypothetical protein